MRFLTKLSQCLRVFLPTLYELSPDHIAKIVAMPMYGKNL